MSTRQALVLVAHADDEALGCAGIIQRLILAYWRVEVIIMSDGLLSVRGEAENNRDHADDAGLVLGVAPRFLGYADQRFDTYCLADMANAARDAISRTPDLIVTHSPDDLNLDHRITCDVAKIIGRPKTKPVSILACEIPSTAFWNGQPFRANYYVEMYEAELDRKVEAFRCYRNEFQEYPHPWSDKGLRLLASYHGMQSGFGYAEAFQVIRANEGRLL